MRLAEAAKVISDFRTNEVVIATMSAKTVWSETSRSDFDLCYFSPMGTASSVGLGLALARPDLRVMVLDGDGSLLMNLGSLVTIAGEAPANLVLFVVENGCYALSGMQPLPGEGKASLCDMARAAGLGNVFKFSTVRELTERVEAIISASGPVFVSLKVEPEPTPHLERMVATEHRSRTSKEGWHRLHGLLGNAADAEQAQREH